MNQEHAAQLKLMSKTAWAQVVVGLLAPAALCVLPLSLSVLFVLPIIGTHFYGKQVGRDEIRNFVECSDKKRSQACATFTAGVGAPVAGEVVSGTNDLLLVFDGSAAYLLKRSNDLRGTVRIR